MKYFPKIASISILLTTSLFLAPGYVFAQDPPKIEGLTNIYRIVIDLAFPVAGLVAFGMLVYGGYMWMIAAGDPGKIQQAQGTITWSVIGLGFLAIFSMLIGELLKFFGLS